MQWFLGDFVDVGEIARPMQLKDAQEGAKADVVRFPGLLTRRAHVIGIAIADCC